MENLVYDLVAYIIVLSAIFLAVRKVVRKFNTKGEVSCSTGCEGCSSKCDLAKNITQLSNLKE